MESARAHFHVIGLQDDATVARPEGMEPENKILELVEAAGRDMMGLLASPGNSDSRPASEAAQRRAR